MQKQLVMHFTLCVHNLCPLGWFCWLVYTQYKTVVCIVYRGLVVNRNRVFLLYYYNVLMVLCVLAVGKIYFGYKCGIHGAIIDHASQPNIYRVILALYSSHL